ncbi:MAG: hypothetical protein WBP45_09175 [Daejeonella sp.]
MKIQNTGLIFGILSPITFLLLFLIPVSQSINTMNQEYEFYSFLALISFIGVIIISLTGLLINIIAYVRASQGQPRVKSIIGMILCGLTAFFIII